ncbi:hypothetical protein [Desmospora activa]|uniref:Uncharacterized protein n=1 Tax=Desmospora activa DSM 45169 TaxID=1121389 RepID=A0A2T4Z8Y1_9BACL|nr:hypothetical protein [Desmospora activa]PTM58351.1 hypothetical protein C8J48_0933 [Desmospora activa DSM 45169]
METRIVTITNRDWFRGTKVVEVEWKCPTCGEPMGEPKLRRFCEDGEWYDVHVWDNECGHIAKYRHLKIVNG